MTTATQLFDHEKLNVYGKTLVFISWATTVLECAASLDVLVAKRVLQPNEITEGKELLRSIAAMLVGLIKSVAPDRVFEDPATYDANVSES